VLVVDDMETNRQLIINSLQPSRYVVAEAIDGKGALDMLACQQFDVVVLDVMLPDMDGFEICRTIRRNPDLHLLPVIMLTVLDSPDSLVRGMEAGATDYISKSFNSVELTAKVAAAAEKKRTTDRLDDTESVLFALARMVEAKDETTGNHCDRLSYMAMVFGQELGLDYDDLDALRRGPIASCSSKAPLMWMSGNSCGSIRKLAQACALPSGPCARPGISSATIMKGGMAADILPA